MHSLDHGTADDGIEELLKRVPAESRALVAQLLDEPLLSRRVLQGEVVAHLQLCRAAPGAGEELDIAQAEALAKQCERLLEAVDDEAPESQRRLVQTAVRYFAIEDDGDDDLKKGGLCDDAAVVAAVEQLLSEAAAGAKPG